MALVRIRWKKARWKQIAKDDSGVEIAEAAFVLPLVFLLIFGILWLGRAFNIYTTLNRAAQEAAAAAALSDCATCTGAPFDVQAKVINPILSAAHLDPAQLTISPTSLVPTQLDAGPPPINGFKVDLSYPYSFKLNGITCCPLTLTPITSGITLTAHAEALQEN
jgi:Flp pilus assembly protein TadG